MKAPHRFGRPRTAKRRELRHRLLLRDGPWCICCRVRFTFDNLPTIEHLTPISQGGRSILRNLALLCERCNGGRDHTHELAMAGSS